jgi:hypothetical protein
LGGQKGVEMQEISLQFIYITDHSVV